MLDIASLLVMPDCRWSKRGKSLTVSGLFCLWLEFPLAMCEMFFSSVTILT